MKTNRKLVKILHDISSLAELGVSETLAGYEDYSVYSTLIQISKKAYHTALELEQEGTTKK